MATEHRFEKKYGAWIYCVCGWDHDSLFDFLNERALKRHLEMHGVGLEKKK